MRKEANLTVDDIAKLEVGEAFANAALLKKHADSIKKTTNLSDIKFVPGDAAPHLYNSGVSHS
jgi:hypothetical protein